MTHSIQELVKEHFGKNDKLTWEDCIDFVNAYHSYFDFKLREIVSNTFWKIEAYFTTFYKNSSLLIVFNRDVFSPSRVYSQREFVEILDNLTSVYNHIKEKVWQ